jgi:hypothetical protein
LLVPRQAEDVKLKMPLTEEASDHLKSIKATGFDTFKSFCKMPAFLTSWVDHGIPPEPDTFSGPFIVAQKEVRITVHYALTILCT